MSRGPDAATLLERRLLLAAQAGGLAVTLAEVQSVPWASATFNGARHQLLLEAPACPALDAWLTALPDAELPLRGHLVADLVVAAMAVADGVLRATIEALTVEDR